ncbi:DUF1292 domain-containing protein [Ureibacillus sp. FSL W8-0352]|uniref:DUF1292 domain-containing protein n=1 Tax=Ureibacillus sp. FSL W8-0352 TaxID=2954596 RepID=UPI0030F4F548
MDQQYFYLTTEDGVEMKCKVLFTFDTDDYSYCIYTIIDEDGNESEEISAVRYELDENLEMTNFQELETEEEWDMVEEVYNTLVDTFSEEERDAFIATDEEGNEIECKVIYRFKLDEFGKKYVVYTTDETEPVENLYVASYVDSEDGEIQEIFPVESDEEWEKIEESVEFLNQ